MRDSVGRALTYLRVSVTDRCNLRCRYCMPPGDVPFTPHAEVLRYEEIARLVAIMVRLGMRKVRLTGGEPLVRRNLDRLITMIRPLPDLATIALTTNGLLLPDQAEALKEAGLDAVNLSIDTLDRARYARATGFDACDRALDGLRVALTMGFHPVKVNAVVDAASEAIDWLSVASLAERDPIDVRFIEVMPMCGQAPETGRIAEVKAALEARYGTLTKVPSAPYDGPAEVMTAIGLRGRFGFISAVSKHHCDACNRLRLTATGGLKLCLYYDNGVELKPYLRGGADDNTLADVIIHAVAQKPKAKGDRLAALDDTPVLTRRRGMHATGG